jgi:hypothetical protein
MNQVDVKSFGGSALPKGYKELSAYHDAKSIDPADVPLFATYLGSLDELVARAFGKTTVLNPKGPLNHAQAALLLWRLGDSSAADALKSATPSPAPTATP